MYKYEIEIPGQGTFEVESQTELTDAQAYQAAMQQVQKPSVGQRFVQGIVDPLDAAAQLLPRGLGYLSSYGGLYPNPVSQFFQGQAEDVQRGIRERTAPMQQEGIDFARMAGNVVSPAGIVPAARVAGGAGPTMAAARVGAMGGALTPVERPEEAFGQQKALQIASGAALGPVLEKAGAVVAPRITEAAQRLKEAGVRDLTPGQAFGGAVQKIEQGLESIPWIGELFSGARARNIQEFNRAAYNKVLSNIGEEIPADKVGRDAFRYVDTSLAKEYDKLVPKLKLPQSTILGQRENGALYTLEDEISSIATRYAADLPEGVPNRVEKIVNNYVLSNLQKGDLTGRQAKQAESILSSQINKLLRSSDADQKAAGQALLNVQAAIRDAIEVANPEFRGQLQPINQAWSELKILQKAAQTGQEGVFSPQALLQATKQGDTSRGRAFARGEARMQPLAEAGRAALGPQIPDSGTTTRGLVGLGGLAGFGAIDPTSAAITAAAGLGYSKPLQPYMSKLFTERPELLGIIGPTMRRALPYITPGLLGEEERQ